jgi:CsbD-like protein
LEWGIGKFRGPAQPHEQLEAPVLPEHWGFSSQRRAAMDWDRVQGSWKQLTGKVKEKWGKLTDDDLTASASSVR